MKALLITLLLLPFTLMAAQEWVINKDHSELFFSVPYLNVSEVTGRFSDFRGSAQFDDQTQISALDLQIQVSSLNTENKLRDGHLKAPDFLNIRLYPVITFVSSKVTSVDGKHYLVEGSLNLHGITKKIEINFELSPSLKDSWGYDNRFAKFDFSIQRKDYDLEWNKTLAENKYLVGEEIEIHGAFQLQPLNSLTPGNKHFIPVTSFTRGKEKLKRGEISKEEFDKLYLNSEAKNSVTHTPNESSPESSSHQVVISEKSEDTERSLNWWISLGVLGLLGFFAAIIVGFYAKQQLLDLFPKKYSEGGILGNFGDLLVVGITIIYSIAFWYVGWGK